MSERAIRVEAAQTLYASGRFTQDDIAVALGVERSTVTRWCAQAKPEARFVANLQRLLDERAKDLDGYGEFQAEQALLLARRLDQVANSTKAQDALAMPQISKELGRVVSELLGPTEDDRAWLADVFAQMGDAADPGQEDFSPAGSGAS